MRDIVLIMCQLAFIITMFAFLVIGINRKLGKQTSSYLLFAIVDLIAGILVVVYAIYIFHKATGKNWVLIGQLVLMIGCPVVVLLLFIDLILWWKQKK